ncbi:hypothetical protein DPMN_137048 [Dreissena polymorpha]|uniref:Uncharacterized protein n=1 Tax=Dreissena polymorpha TaxID=45954 RepID=A0A9D4G4I5_DREPO|nr:hypothetical protein DPMN_137048 [Dreissena polymorpha]
MQPTFRALSRSQKSAVIVVLSLFTERWAMQPTFRSLSRSQNSAVIVIVVFFCSQSGWQCSLHFGHTRRVRDRLCKSSLPCEQPINGEQEDIAQPHSHAHL